MLKPHIRSEWTRIVEYPDRHLNDFCLFRALDGRWHAMGIMGTGTWDSERSLFHCSGSRLHGKHEKHSPLLARLERGPTSNDAPQKHAPFVVIRDGTHHLFFRRPPGTNLLLRSKVLRRWPSCPEMVFE